MPSWPATYQELRELNRSDLVALYDGQAAITTWSAKHIVEELHRRDSELQTEAMRRHTKHITVLTWVIAGLTLVNAATFVWVAFR